MRHISGQSGFNNTCVGGLCTVIAGSGNRAWEQPSNAGTWLSNTTSLNKSRSIGTHTGNYRLPMSNYPDEALPVAQAADPVNALAPVPVPVQIRVGGVSRQPRYLIEAIPDTRPGVSVSVSGGPVGPEFVYRVSSIGFGTDPNTRVVLQMMYKP